MTDHDDEERSQVQFAAELVEAAARLLSRAQQDIAVADYCDREQHYGEGAARRLQTVERCQEAITALQRACNRLIPPAPAADESAGVERPYWISWWHNARENGAFELSSPWWISGGMRGGEETICAAVRATSPAHARAIIRRSHDRENVRLEWRFVEARPLDWVPFSDRFPRRNWMQWPEAACPGSPPDSLPVEGS